MGFAAVRRSNVQHEHPSELLCLFYQSLRSIMQQKNPCFREVSVSALGSGNFSNQLLYFVFTDYGFDIFFPPKAGIAISAIVFYDWLWKVLFNNFFRDTVLFYGCFLINILFVGFTLFCHKNL